VNDPTSMPGSRGGGTDVCLITRLRRCIVNKARLAEGEESTEWAQVNRVQVGFDVYRRFQSEEEALRRKSNAYAIQVCIPDEFFYFYPGQFGLGCT